MNAWLRIRRLRGPAFIILFGIMALLHQYGVLSFGRSWPLYLILAGVFGLAERAVLTASPLPPAPYVPAVPYGGYATSPGTSIVPSYGQQVSSSAEVNAYSDPSNPGNRNDQIRRP